MRELDYDVARPLIQQGDVIAFGGEGLASRVIQWFTKSPVSHVAVVDQTTPDAQGLYTNRIIESTSLNGMAGVTYNRLSKRLLDYRGRIWWLPLAEEFRERIDWDKFHTWLAKQNGKPYNTKGAINSALDRLEKLPGIGRFFHNPDRYSKLFCSQLVCGAFKHCGALPARLDASEMTPADLVSMAIYSDCTQLKGDLLELKGFNRIPPNRLVS